MFDLKVINSVLEQLEDERGIAKEKVLEAIEFSLASAYKKEYGKKGQIIKAKFDINTGGVEFSQVKIVTDKDSVIMPEDEDSEEEVASEESPQNSKVEKADDDTDIRVRYNPEHHILLEEAKLIKTDAEIDDEIVFPLENKEDFGRIAAQTAKQVITQKIREAEKTSVMSEFGEREGEIISGTVQRMERGAVYLDMGRAVGMLPYEEQIPGERFKQGERVRAYLYKVDETSRGVFLKLSRSHPKFLEELFKAEVPELTQGVVELKAIAREAGSRSKVAVVSNDEHIDPVGALVGQRGVRVSTIMSELGGEKIDVIEWSEDIGKFIEDSLSPAAVIDVEILSGTTEATAEGEDREERLAKVTVSADQQSLAIGKGGQNVRLAAKLTGWKIDIVSIGGEEEEEVEAPTETNEEVKEEAPVEESTEAPAEEEKTEEAEESTEENQTEEEKEKTEE